MSGTGTLATIGDADTDDDTFTVKVKTPPPSGVVASTTGYTITIKDTKAFAVVKPELTVAAKPEADEDNDRFAVSVDEGESVTVTATLDRAHSADIVLPVTLDPEEAEPTDYGSLASITIKAGQKTGTGTVTTNHDDDEDDESFSIAVDPSGLGDAVEKDSSYEFTVEIVDDDKPPPTVGFSRIRKPFFCPKVKARARGVTIQAGETRPSQTYHTLIYRQPADYDVDVYVDVTQEGRYF